MHRKQMFVFRDGFWNISYRGVKPTFFESFFKLFVFEQTKSKLRGKDSFTPPQFGIPWTSYEVSSAIFSCWKIFAPP